MFTETSLFRIIKQLDLLATLSGDSEESYQIVQRFSDPSNLKNIIENPASAFCVRHLTDENLMKIVKNQGKSKKIPASAFCV